MDAKGALSQSLSPCCLTVSTVHWKVSRDTSDARSAFGCKNDLAKWDTPSRFAHSALQERQGSVLPSSAGMSFVHTHTR